MNRPLSYGPKQSKLDIGNKIKTECDFGAQGTPLTIVTVSLSEFKSPDDAKAWADQASSPRSPEFSVDKERSLGDAAVWVSGRNSASYVVRQGTKVLEVTIRGASGGGVPFQVTPAMRPLMRKAAQGAVEKLR
ncbi:MAG: hypothetical protein Q8L40_00650 [Burkholderiales bacterium]|nr:hypothetical protein [Burkholderiales bacterium]